MRDNAKKKHTGANLILIRGLPGSGKSTLAKSLVGYEHFEADMFFTKTGEYVFDPLMLSEAHAWCLEQTKAALEDGKSVVVSNTFTRYFEIEPYLNLGFPVEVMVAS